MNEKTLPSPAWAQVALILGIWGAIALSVGINIAPVKAGLFATALLLGLVLKHAAFGFTTHFRRLLVAGDGRGVRAQMVMLAVASGLMLPVLAHGSILGHGVIGAVAPAGVSVMAGAFMFGLAMQIANGCASGTLYSVGSGSMRLLVALPFFLLGSLLGSAHLPWWLQAPSAGSVSLLARFGLWPALLGQWAAFAAIFGLLRAMERRRGIAHPPPARPRSLMAILTGPWGWMAGGVLLAVLNFATLALSGHAWTISFGFALWGAKAAQGLGFDLSTVDFWTWPYPARALAGPWLAEDTSLMNLGIIIGAALSVALSGGFSCPARIPLRGAIGAGLGGLLMGYGARIAFGCNVGAYFSGIATASLHGWEWLLFGLLGSWAGVRLRPLFGLPNP